MRCWTMCVVLVGWFAASSASAQERSALLRVGAYTIPPVAGRAVPCDVPPRCAQPVCADKICRLHVKTESIKKTCFEVECQPICIPPVTFPWEQSPCGAAGCDGATASLPGKCGRVRHVHVPLTRSYECGTRCVCEWKLEDACPPGCAPHPAGGLLPPPPATDDDARNSAERQPAGRPATLGWLRWPWRS